MITGTKTNDRSAGNGSAAGHSATHDLITHYAALLRHVLTEQANLGTPAYAIGITSSGCGEGVTTVATNLAITAARSSNRRVLLIDTHSGHDGPARKLSLSTEAGLSEALLGQSLLGECLRETDIPGLSLLSWGHSECQLGMDYELEDAANLIDEVKSEYDLIVCDLPHADELSECFTLSEILDGVFLIVEAGRVDRRVARRAQNRLTRTRAQLLGAIYNKCQ